MINKKNWFSTLASLAKNVFQLAATLRGSWPGAQSASPKTPKNTSFF